MNPLRTTGKVKPLPPHLLETDGMVLRFELTRDRGVLTGPFVCDRCDMASRHRVTRFDTDGKPIEFEDHPMQCRCGSRQFLYPWEASPNWRLFRFL